MKNIKLKKFSLLFCILCLAFGLTACSDTISSQEAKQSLKQKKVAEYETQLKDWADDMINFLDTTSSEQLKEYAENSTTLDEINKTDYIVNPDGMNVATVEFYNGWNKTKEDLGKIKSVDDIKVELNAETGKLCTISAKVTYEARECAFEFTIKDDLSLESGAINPTYTTGEKMEKAVMNTLIGMGTVFAVLIFISFIIYLLKFVNVIGTKKNETEKSADTGVDNAIAQIVSNETVGDDADETDDLELIAVITAAIAASEGPSSDGLVVRSIRKRNNWK